jgi:hypothetical protein
MPLLRYGVASACEWARLRISSFRYYATVGNARSCYIGVLARGEQGAMCGFDAHWVTPPLEYGLLLRSRASKVL